MKTKKLVKIALGSMFIFGSISSLSADRKYDHVLIDRVLLDDRRYGQCMIHITEPAFTDGCPSTWATFSCSGDFNDSEFAWRMYDQAQLAFALGAEVRLHLENTQKHNGYCTIKRIDVYAPTE